MPLILPAKLPCFFEEEQGNICIGRTVVLRCSAEVGHISCLLVCLRRSVVGGQRQQLRLPRVPGEEEEELDVFVAHLCVADFRMGVFLAVIGVVARLYQCTYLWEDNTWKDSAGCKVAGFLSLVSNEVSALVIALITIDRFLVLRFPSSSATFALRLARLKWRASQSGRWAFCWLASLC